MRTMFIKLENYYNVCTTSQKKVVKYIIENPHDVLDTDIHTLAKKCFSSSSTIVRICKENGYTGFKELKKALYKEIQYIEEVSLDLLHNKEINDVLQGVTISNVKSIEQSKQLLDIDTMNKVVDLMANSTHISLYGIGASFLVAKDMQMKLERIGINTGLFEDTHLQLVKSTNTKKSDLCFVVSYSGQTPEIVQIAKNIKSNSGILVSIVRYGNSPLASNSDFIFNVSSIEKNFRYAASSSRIAQLNVVDMIYYSLFNKLYDSKITKLLKTSDLLNKNKIVY